MKSKLLFLGLVVLLLAGGLVLASCNLCPGGGTSGGAGNCYIKAAGGTLYYTSSYKECEDRCGANWVINNRPSNNTTHSCSC
jgi:hypothetical protein